MTIKFGNVTENIRNSFINNIELIMNYCQTKEQSNRIILYYFYYIRCADYNLYKNIIGLIASDHYKIINEFMMQNVGIIEDDFYYLKLYESISNQDELISIIENDPSMILEIICYMNDFNCYDYFEKRRCYLRCKDKIEILSKLSPYSVFDYLYYCQKYDANIIKTIYNEQLEIYNDKDYAINTLITTIEELFDNDLSNYSYLMSELLINYYIIGKKQIKSDKTIVKRDYLSKNLRLIENSDIIDILNRLKSDDYKFLIEVLRRNINNYDENVSINTDNEREQKTLKKINDIKNFNIIE